MVHYLHGKSVHIKGGLPSTSEGLTLQTKERRAMPMITYSDLIQRGKEGDANVCYIFGFNPDRYLVGCPCQSHLRDFQGKEIAAHYSQ